MSRWFRVYDDILDDPKVQLLSPELFKAWINILALASRNKGRLPPLAAMAFALRLSPSEMQAKLDELILAGLVDIMKDKGLEPHNWGRRQWASDDSLNRVRKHRAAKRQQADVTGGNGGVTVTVTAPEIRDTDTDLSESESDQTSEKKIDRSFELCSIDESEALAEPVGPTATSVPAARKRARQWEAAEPSEVPADTVPAARRPAPIRAFVSEDALEAVRNVAPGWDRQFLLKRFTEFNSGKHIRAPDKAFLAWVRSFTKGQNLWRQ